MKLRMLCRRPGDAEVLSLFSIIQQTTTGIDIVVDGSAVFAITWSTGVSSSFWQT